MKRPLSQNARLVNNSERIQINNNDQIQSLANNEENMDSLIAQIYEENIEKITTLTNILQISEITSYISFLAFLILLAIKLSSIGNFYWSFLNIPGIITILAIAVTLNSILSLKHLIDTTEQKVRGESSSSLQPSTVFSYVILNGTSLCALIFIIILSLSLDKIIVCELTYLFIPLYIALILCLAYAVFIAPAFIYNKLYFDVFLVFSYAICAVIFITLLGVKSSSENSTFKYCHVFIPLYFAIGAHILVIALKAAITPKEKARQHLLIGIALLLSFGAAVVCQAKNDKIIQNKNHFVEVILVILAFLLYATNSIWTTLDDENEANDDRKLA